jgi:hypothetical protein
MLMTNSQKTKAKKNVSLPEDSCCDDSCCGGPSTRFESEGGGSC